MGSVGSKAAETGLKCCTLWKADRSPACRAVMMTLDSLKLSLSEVDVNMDKGEHRAPEMCIMNPLQTLPILKDRELVLYDSHAICSYLASRYCDCRRLLPQDAGGRALTDQYLHFNSGILYPRYRAAAVSKYLCSDLINLATRYIDGAADGHSEQLTILHRILKRAMGVFRARKYPILYENCNFVMPQQVCDIENAYTDLETMLSGRSWFGGSWPTLGDIVFASTVSTLHVLVPVDEQRYPRLSSWLFRVSEEMFYTTANKKGLGEFSRRIGELTELQKT